MRQIPKPRAAITLALVLLICLSNSRAQQPATMPLGAVSTDANAAREKYVAAVNRAREDFNQRVQAAHEQYTRRLEALQKEETKRGNLEAALSIRAELAELRASGPPMARIDSPDAMYGKWHAKMITGYECDLIVRPAQVQHIQSGHAAVPRFKGNQLVVQWPNGNVDRLTVAGERMLYEYWEAGSKALQGVPTALGVLERVRE
jgi:hypothetical protein